MIITVKISFLGCQSVWHELEKSNNIHQERPRKVQNSNFNVVVSLIDFCHHLCHHVNFSIIDWTFFLFWPFYISSSGTYVEHAMFLLLFVWFVFI